MKIKLSICLLALVMLSACGRPEFVDAQGNGINWQDFEGQWLVVNYWATWCKPCMDEIPELNKLHDEQGKRVLGINFDQPELAELQRQIKQLNVQFPVLYTDTDQQLAYLTPQVLPTTYLFDRQGQLKRKLVGPQTQASIAAVIEEFK